MKTNDEAEKIINESSYFSMSISGAERGIKKLVTVPINENQFSALVSLLISVGSKDFKQSQVLRLTNKGQFLLAAEHFRDHIVGENDQGTKHLKARRRKERRLFTKPILEINNGKTPGVAE